MNLQANLTLNANFIAGSKGTLALKMFSASDSSFYLSVTVDSITYNLYEIILLLLYRIMKNNQSN